MKLWLIWQDENTGYDTYDSAVVLAETEEEARGIHPDPYWQDNWEFRYWASSPKRVRAKYLGEAVEGLEGRRDVDGEATPVIVASFNAE